MLPTTTIGLAIKMPASVLPQRRHLGNTGATATAPSPTTKNMNINGTSLLALGGALANSFQIKTPQMAETIVAPCPIAYEIAGPMTCACEATKFRTAPVHQIIPPRIPHQCQAARPFQ